MQPKKELQRLSMGWRSGEGESHRVDLWDGWVFHDNAIFDEDGNRYSKEDVKASFLAHYTDREFRGTECQIFGMKKELRRKIALTKVPKVCLIYQIDGEVVEKVFDLSEV